MATENRRFSVDHVRAVWLWIDIVDCVKRKKISGCAGGLSASYFSNVLWKTTLWTRHHRGGKWYSAHEKTWSPKTTAWDVSTTNWKNQLISLVQFFEKLAVPQAAEMDSQQILPLRHVAEITTKNEGLHVLGIRFYYWLPVNLLKVYRRRRPSILGNRGRALITSRALCSLPVTLLSSP
jgi:hypothetical protein